MASKNKKKIMLYLLRNLELININQLSKKLDISVGSAFKILKELERGEVVLSIKLGNAIFYRLNLENDETIKLCELLLIEERRNLEGYPKIYSDEIKKFVNAGLIVLFGSILKSTDFKDVDVLFVTDKVKEVNNFCSSIAKIKAKPIIPLILKKEDLIKEIKNKREAIINILKTGIVLKGESVFLDVIKNVKF